MNNVKVLLLVCVLFAPVSTIALPLDETGWDFNEEIQNAREVLAKSVHQSGLIQNHIWLGNQMYYFFGGEMLQTFSE